MMMLKYMKAVAATRRDAKTQFFTTATLPLFVGLSVVMPVLGHATWHLYRKVVER